MLRKQPPPGRTDHLEQRPNLGILLAGKKRRTPEADRIPVIRLVADPMAYGKYWMEWDFGAATPKRQSLRSADLSTRSKPRVPVAIAHGPDGRPFLVVTRKQCFPNWARKTLLGNFDFPAAMWRADLLVLAAAGHDTRGLGERGPDHLDGDPLNIRAENLALPQEGLPLPRVLDGLSSLATMDEVYGHYRGRADFPALPILAAHLPYVHRLTAKVLERYRLVRLCTRVVEAEMDEEHPEPFFQAQTTVHCMPHASKWEEAYSAEGAGYTAEEAVFFSRLDAIRSAVFYGYDVAYCGVLLRQGPLEVTLAPLDLYVGHYRLTITIDSASTAFAPPLVKALAMRHNGPYELTAEIERKARTSRTVSERPKRGTYVKIVGGIPKDIREVFGSVIDFKRYPVRLHRLLVALAGDSLLDPRPLLARVQRWGVPVSPLQVDPTFHVHHRHGIGLYNHSWGLSVRSSRQHGRTHLEWAESMEAAEVSQVRGVSRAGRLDDLAIDSPDWATRIVKTLHTTTSRALGRPKLAPQPLPEPTPQARDLHKALVRLATPKGRKRPRHDALKPMAVIVRELWGAGGTMATRSLMTLTCLPESTFYKWLEKLLEAGIVAWNKGGRTAQGKVCLVKARDINVPPPLPRRRR